MCCSGITLNWLNRWLDYWFQQLKPQVVTYIKDNNQLFQKLKQVKEKLIQADATKLREEHLQKRATFYAKHKNTSEEDK